MEAFCPTLNESGCAEPLMDEHGKSQGQTDPEGAHEHRLLEWNPFVLAAYDCEVENQQDENYRVENNPEPEVHG